MRRNSLIYILCSLLSFSCIVTIRVTVEYRFRRRIVRQCFNVPSVVSHILLELVLGGIASVRQRYGSQSGTDWRTFRRYWRTFHRYWRTHSTLTIPCVVNVLWTDCPPLEIICFSQAHIFHAIGKHVYLTSNFSINMLIHLRWTVHLDGYFTLPGQYYSTLLTVNNIVSVVAT